MSPTDNLILIQHVFTCSTLPVRGAISARRLESVNPGPFPVMHTTDCCVALLAYDHLLTLSGEIQFVWGRKFSGATVVFVLNRYVTLFGKIVLPISTFWWPNQTDDVRRLYPQIRSLTFSYQSPEVPTPQLGLASRILTSLEVARHRSY